MRPTSIAIRRASKGYLRGKEPIFSGKCLRCARAAPSASIFTAAASALSPPTTTSRNSSCGTHGRLLPRHVGKNSFRLTYEQRRTLFFGLFSSQEADPIQQRGHDPNPGVLVLGTLVRFLDERVGYLPDTPDLIKAFDQVIHGDKRLILTPGVAYGLCRLFELLIEREEAKLLDIRAVRQALINVSTGSESIHVKLAVFLFDHIYEYEENDNFRITAYHKFITLLSKHKKYDMAIEVCQRLTEEYPDNGVTPHRWAVIMDAYVESEDEAGLMRLFDIMKESEVKLIDRHYEKLMSLYMRKDDLPKVKEVYDQLVKSQVPITHLEVYRVILGFCMKHKNQPGVMDWGNAVFKNILEAYSMVEHGQPCLKAKGETTKETWDLALEWCAAIGKSLDDIERLMHAVSKHPAAKFQPDIETINGLVEFSLENQNPYKAERFAALAQKWGFDSNRRSLVLQIYARIMGRDFEGAHASWRDLRFFEIADDDQGAETLALLRALCQQENANPQNIIDVYENIRQRKLPLDVETLCVYLQYMMKQLDLPEFVDVLTRDVQQFLPSEREQVIMTIYEHMAKESTTEEDSWELYRVAKEVLVEMSLDVRRRIMNLFFSKGRIDMASVVFTHMRHSNHSRADKQAYIECIQGVANSRDGKVLMEMINLLKIDPEIELDTELRNSMMWGYKLCGFPHKAMDVYDDIRRSEEGPDKNTLSAVMSTCGEIPGGMVRNGEKIWREFGNMGFQYTEHNYAMYIEGWIHNGYFQKAFDLAKNMEANMNIRPGGATLYTLYTEMPPNMRDAIMQWIRENYQQEWNELLALPEQPIQNYEASVEKVAQQRRQEAIEYEL